jgi:hypothetical protein
LARIIEAGEVAEFSDDRDGNGELHATRGLQGLYHRVQTPVAELLAQVDLEPLQALVLRADGADILLSRPT